MKVIIKDKHTGYHEGAGAEDSVGISRDAGRTVADFIPRKVNGSKNTVGGGEVGGDDSLVPDWNNIFLRGYF